MTFLSQEQLAAEGCVMCTNYEQQLQKVQKEKQALQELAAKLQNSVDKDQKIKVGLHCKLLNRDQDGLHQWR